VIELGLRVGGVRILKVLDMIFESTWSCLAGNVARCINLG